MNSPYKQKWTKFKAGQTVYFKPSPEPLVVTRVEPYGSIYCVNSKGKEMGYSPDDLSDTDVSESYLKKEAELFAGFGENAGLGEIMTSMKGIAGLVAEAFAEEREELEELLRINPNHPGKEILEKNLKKMQGNS
jgi:hypothetical protein